MVLHSYCYLHEVHSTFAISMPSVLVLLYVFYLCDFGKRLQLAVVFTVRHVVA